MREQRRARKASLLVLAQTGVLCASCGPLLDKWAEDPFDIELRYIGWTPSSDEEQQLREAASRWESVIVEGHPDSYVRVTEEQIAALPAAEECQPLSERVDDLVVFVTTTGEESPLAAGKICSVDGGGTGLPTSGRVKLSTRVLDGGDREDQLKLAVEHELGHILAYAPGLWNLDRDLDGSPELSLVPGYTGDCPTGTAVEYVGAAGVAAYAALGGEGGVPLEPASPTSGGSACVHLAEAVFGDALMTPYPDGSGAPLTSVSVGMLADLGYAVTGSHDDPYVLPALRDVPLQTNDGEAEPPP